MRVDEVFKQAASQGTAPVSFEMFPPKGELTLDTAREVAGNLCKLSPSFVSVTCSAGGSGNGATTAPIAHMISSEFDTPSVAHLTCVGRTHADIAAKMVEGSVQKYLKEVSLADQVFVKAADGKQTVAAMLKDIASGDGDLTQRLADLRFIAELPRSAIGKVLKRELRDQYAAGR